MAGKPILRKEAHGAEKAVWTLRVSAIDEHGNRVQPAKTFRGIKSKAWAEMVKYETEVHADIKRKIEELAQAQEVGGPTLDEVFNLWVEAPARNGRVKSASTQYQDTKRYEKHIQPQFGHRQMAGIEPEEIETFYYKLSFRVTGEAQQPLSETTIHRVHEIFQAMYNYALRKKLIAVSPFTDIHRAQVRLADPSAPKKLAVAELLAHLRESDLELFCAVNICAVTGARRSEVISLRWGDIDLENATVRLTHGLIAVPGKGMIETNTKTGEIVADGLDVGQHLKMALTEFRNQKFGKDVSPKKIAPTFVFAADDEGKRPWHPDTLSARLRKACEAKGGNAPTITLKDLRTFVASELSGQPFGLQLVKSVLRHRSSATTLRHYLAAEKKRNREATGQLAEVLGLTTMRVLDKESPQLESVPRTRLRKK
jgi:integrase